MTRYTVVDAGAIVAFLDRRDQWSKLAQKLFYALPKPLLTCEIAVAESFYLLGESNKARQNILGLLMDGIVSIEFSLGSETAAIQNLLDKYKDVPMSIADACLVRMSEVFDAPVFTFDSDFRIYRRHRRNVIPLIGIDN